MLEMTVEDDLVDREGKKIGKVIFSYKNYSREKDLGKSAMEFGAIMCAVLNNEISEGEE
jgi:hypothetical protein